MDLEKYKTANLLGSEFPVKSLPINLSANGEYANISDWYNELCRLSNEEIIYFGGYLEKRFFYSNEALFGQGSEARIIHLGLDLWIKQGTSIFSPFNARVKYIKYNDKSLDYGHTLILEHKLGKELPFYSLYGHLNNYHGMFEPGAEIPAGSKIAEIGSPSENGGWPPHLHLQLIKDLGNYNGDYPGVCTIEELEYYKINCPDPTPLFTKYA